MITKEVIKNIYRKYPRRADGADDLDIAMLFETVGNIHNIRIDIDADTLTIGSINPRSPFHDLPLSHVHAFVPFDQWTAAVLANAIIFLNRREPKVTIHIKPARPTLADHLRSLFHRKS